MKILFTGHRGFLGKELIPILSKDFEICEYTGDLCDFDRISKYVSENKIAKIIHAAVRGGRRIKVDDSRVLEENLIASVNLLLLGLPMLAFCSGAIYGRQVSLLNSREEEAGDRYPTDYYGQSKFLFRKLAIDKPNTQFLRFFNVFGKQETPERFLKANIGRYINKEPMQIFQDFYMDFFFVEDSIQLVLKWLYSQNLPNEINLVYSQKYLLSDICNKINALNSHKVQILILNEQRGKDYCGDGSLLNSMNLQLKGLDYGISKMYENLK